MLHLRISPKVVLAIEEKKGRPSARDPHLVGSREDRCMQPFPHKWRARFRENLSETIEKDFDLGGKGFCCFNKFGIVN